MRQRKEKRRFAITASWFAKLIVMLWSLSLCVCVSSISQSTDPTTRWRSARAVDQTATNPNTWTRSSAPSKVCGCVCVFGSVDAQVCLWQWRKVWWVNRCVCVCVWTLSHLKLLDLFILSSCSSTSLCEMKAGLVLYSTLCDSSHPFVPTPALLPTTPLVWVCFFFCIYSFASFSSHIFLNVRIIVRECVCGSVVKP